MENAADALIMAFGVLIFVLALSISISLFGQAREASDVVFSLMDKENDYIYVDHTDNEGNANSTRIVKIDTVISSMYRAYRENYKIYFFKKTGENSEEKFPLYISNKNGQEVNTIDFGLEIARGELWIYNINGPYDFLDDLISGKNSSDFSKIYNEGLYKVLKDEEIIEYLGEYYQQDLKEENSNTAEVNKTKERIITYVIK